MAEAYNEQAQGTEHQPKSPPAEAVQGRPANFKPRLPSSQICWTAFRSVR